MSKTVQIELTEKEYKNLMLCYSLGDLIKDGTEQKSPSEMQFQMAMLQKLSKAGYEAKLPGAEYERGIYSYGQEIEEEMLSIYDAFREYIESGEAEEDDELIRQQIAEMERQEKRKK